MSRCPDDAIQGAQGWLLFDAWLAGLPLVAAVWVAYGAALVGAGGAEVAAGAGARDVDALLSDASVAGEGGGLGG